MTLGFVVLARRPNPYKEDPWDYEVIGGVRLTADLARSHADVLNDGNSGPMEYVVGEIHAASMPNSTHTRADILRSYR